MINKAKRKGNLKKNSVKKSRSIHPNSSLAKNPKVEKMVLNKIN